MLKRAAAPAGLTLAGVIVALLSGDSTAGVAAAIVLIGSAAVVAVALVFYAVGRAEERDLEQAESARPPQPPPPLPPATERSGLASQRRRGRPPRRPG